MSVIGNRKKNKKKKTTIYGNQEFGVITAL